MVWYGSKAMASFMHDDVKDYYITVKACAQY